MKIRTILIVFVAAFVLSACGRAGAPLSPYQATVKQAKEDKTPPPEKPVKDRPFILDGLLN